jgi:hypothetical protein
MTYSANEDAFNSYYLAIAMLRHRLRIVKALKRRAE